MTLTKTLALISDDDLIDKMSDAHRAEHDRWSWHFKIGGGFELHRRLDDDGAIEVVNLTRRECRDKHDAELWCRTYAGRAAMRAAISRSGIYHD